MRKRLVAGNWKMNGSVAVVRDWCAIVARQSGLDDVDMLLFPPFPYLELARQVLGGTRIEVGAQDVSPRPMAGAFTGEVSVAMLCDVGCTSVLVGHSERRRLHGESDELVAEKFETVLRGGLRPVLCVGETLEERDAGLTETAVMRQMCAVLDRMGPDALVGWIVAYEPVWAIGTGRTATPAQAQAVHENIRATLRSVNDILADSTVILYGGSVNSDNAAALFEMPDIDGALVGGASLIAHEFLRIAQAAA